MRDLNEEFRKLAGRPPHARGFAFEDLVVELFRRSGFQAHRNPNSARPRQLDFHAQRGALVILGSAKWQRKRVGPPEVDELLSALRQLPSDVIGCLLSMSEFSQTTFPHVVEHRRDREILLFDPFEVESMFAGRAAVCDLVRRKQTAMRKDGVVWFAERATAEQPVSLIDLPQAGLAMVDATGRSSTFVARTEQAAGFVFTLSLRDVGWGPVHGGGVSLQIALPFEHLREVASFLHHLPSRFGLTPRGSFAIHQKANSWHGFGIRELLAESERWQDRYAHLSGPSHHSEEAVYYDEFQNGILVLTFQQRLSIPSTRIGHCNLEIRLPGVPLDMTPYQHIADLAEVRHPFFSQIQESDCRLLRFKGGYGPRLEVLRKIVANDEYVVGLVARNPYFRNERALRRIDSDGHFHSLSTSEIILCSLSDHHTAGEAPDYYRVTHLESLSAALRPVIAVHGTWNQMPHLTRVGIGPRWDRSRRRSRR